MLCLSFTIVSGESWIFVGVDRGAVWAPGHFHLGCLGLPAAVVVGCGGPPDHIALQVVQVVHMGGLVSLDQGYKV